MSNNLHSEWRKVQTLLGLCPGRKVDCNTLINSGLRVLVCLLVLASLSAVSACAYRDMRRSPPRRVADADAQIHRLEVTAYCPCGACCGWRRNWRGRPVYAYGPNKGERKIVGQTASGTQARPGTIAADTRLFPFGTIMYVPGYGYGVVEDRGGAIKGNKIDLFYRTHQQALQWGRQQMDVKVWYP